VLRLPDTGCGGCEPAPWRDGPLLEDVAVPPTRGRRRRPSRWVRQAATGGRPRPRVFSRNLRATAVTANPRPGVTGAPRGLPHRRAGRLGCGAARGRTGVGRARDDVAAVPSPRPGGRSPAFRDRLHARRALACRILFALVRDQPGPPSCTSARHAQYPHGRPLGTDCPAGDPARWRTITRRSSLLTGSGESIPRARIRGGPQGPVNHRGPEPSIRDVVKLRGAPRPAQGRAGTGPTHKGGPA
jgi:hypothetical protein